VRSEAETHLPPWLLARATLRGNEYAWSPADVETVIEEARNANLISVGGQLQFRLPAGTCECHWVDVDTHLFVPTDLPWPERVQKTAEAALHQFRRIRAECDFIAEGRKGFAKKLAEYEATGHPIENAICFVWYVDSEHHG
jgi:hypothetical protein